MRAHGIYGEMTWRSEGEGFKMKKQHEDEVIRRTLKNAREEESNPCMSPCPVG